MSKRLKSRLTMLIVPSIILVLWEVLGQLGYINRSILPTPSRIIHAAIVLLEEDVLQKDIYISIVRVMEGYILGASFGVAVGILMGIFPVVENLLHLITGLFRPIPIVAWVPVLILWMGIGETSKVTVIAIGTFWPVLVNVMDGIRNVDKKYLEVARTFVKSKWVTLVKVILPASLPGIFTGLSVGVGTAWVSVIGAEMIASSSGLGYLISYSRELAQPDSMLVGVFSIGIVGIVINKIIRMIEVRVLRWNINTARS